MEPGDGAAGAWAWTERKGVASGTLTVQTKGPASGVSLRIPQYLSGKDLTLTAPRGTPATDQAGVPLRLGADLPVIPWPPARGSSSRPRPWTASLSRRRPPLTSRWQATAPAWSGSSWRRRSAGRA